jgi:hypothetical protein
MDDLTKLRIRKRARAVHLVAQGLIVIAVVLAVLNSFVSGELGRLFQTRQLGNAVLGLMDAFQSFSDDRIRDLAAFVPPTDPAARTAWAMRIHEYMQQPVAVFLKDGSHIEWPLKPERFAKSAALVPRLFDPDLPDSLRGGMDTLGAMEIRHLYLVPRRSLDDNVWIVGPLGDSLRWGIVFTKWDTWNVFFAGLNRAKLQTELEPAAAATKHIVDVSGSGDENNPYPKLRVLNGGREIFRSNRLDASFAADTAHLGPLELEVYLSRYEQAVSNALVHRVFPLWQQLLVLVGISALCFTLWRWIAKLTEINLRQ